MAFALLVVYLVFTFVRPGEQSLALQELHIMDVVSIAALLAAGLAVLMGRGPDLRLVQIPLVLGFASWALVSVVLNPLRSDTALTSVTSFMKASATAFFLVLLNVDTLQRLRVVAGVLTALALFVVGQGAWAYHSGMPSPFVIYTALDDGSRPGPADALKPEESELQPLGVDGRVDGQPVNRGMPRIRGLGFVNDPNDLAATLVAIIPLSLALRRKGARVRNILMTLSVMAIIYGIYLTRSRGGVIALAGVLALVVRERLGRTLSIASAVAAVMALVALDFAGGRTMSLDASARGRLWAWSEGLQMLKWSPIWGVGFGNYGQYNERVAHNSFVHCFAELGLVGYFIWLSLVVLTLVDIRALGRQDREAAELPRWGRALMLSLVGFLIGGFFLSRAYDVMLFILVGLAIAMTSLARRSGFPLENQALVHRLFVVLVIEVASIVGIWLYLRIF
jgi:hypothetical protein